MSVYQVKGKGWRYDFWMKGVRYADQWFKTKKEGLEAEAERRKELKNPKPVEETPTDITFLELVNLRLDHVKAYNSTRHYQEYVYMARRWLKQWKAETCREISRSVVERFILERGKVSAFTANKEFRYLRSTFNFAKKRGHITGNPVDGIDFLPVSKKLKHVPTPRDIDLVMELADRDTRDYLWVIRESLGRMSEIDQLTWEDVNLEARYVVLHTRKKKGGHRTPRKIPMTAKLYDVLSRRHEGRDPSKPWVFWHECISSKTREPYVGPYQDRKKFMKTLCGRAGVPYFRFHALRHSGASVMDNNNVPISSIQRILGHENRSTTEIYIHSISDAERSAMDVFERVRQKSHT